MKQTKIKIAIAMVSALLLIISSLMVSALHSSNELSEDSFISLDKAEELAVYQVPGQVEEIELVIEGENKFLAVEIIYQGDEYEVKLNAYTGALWRIEHEQEVDASDIKVKISEDYAKSVASQHVEGRVTDIEAKKINQQVYYEVEIQQDNREFDILVDIVTGKLMRIESNTLDYEEEE